MSLRYLRYETEHENSLVDERGVLLPGALPPGGSSDESTGEVNTMFIIDEESEEYSKTDLAYGDKVKEAFLSGKTLLLRFHDDVYRFPVGISFYTDSAPYQTMVISYFKDGVTGTYAINLHCSLPNSYTIKRPIETVNDGLPTDFPRFTVVGESMSEADFLITPHTSDFTNGYIFICDYKGGPKWYKQIPAFGYNFKQYINSKGEVHYSYQVSESSLENINAYYELCYGVVMDECMKEIHNNIRMLEHGSVEAGYPLECHVFTVLDDNHFVVTTANNVEVTNIPGMEDTVVKVVNNVIQEQKDGKVVWQFETVDYPELYAASVRFNEYANFVSGDIYTDYAHINSVDIDVDGNMLVSFRNIGIVKIDYETKEIMWIMGTGRNDIEGVETAQLPLLQHDARYVNDGSFTIFDNNGSSDNLTRICRYWIDDATKTATNVEIFNTNYEESRAMGYSELIDNNTDVYNIVYGICSGSPAFEEYDFTNNKQNMSITFNDGYDLYNISRAVVNFE